MMIYSLGAGCWLRPTDAIKKYWYKQSIFHAFQPFYKGYFPPLGLFNGKILDEFKNSKTLEIFKCSDNNDINLKINNLGIVHHIQYSNHFNYIKLLCNNDDYYDTFIKLSYDFLYIIDFQREYGKYVTNENLLEFENFLLEKKYNLDNFIYLDVIYNKKIDVRNPFYAECKNLYEGHEEDRFKNTRIKHFYNEYGSKEGFDSYFNVWNNIIAFYNNGRIKYILQKVQ